MLRKPVSVMDVEERDRALDLRLDVDLARAAGVERTGAAEVRLVLEDRVVRRRRRRQQVAEHRGNSKSCCWSVVLNITWTRPSNGRGPPPMFVRPPCCAVGRRVPAVSSRSNMPAMPADVAGGRAEVDDHQAGLVPAQAERQERALGGREDDELLGRDLDVERAEHLDPVLARVVEVVGRVRRVVDDEAADDAERERARRKLEGARLALDDEDLVRARVVSRSG